METRLSIGFEDEYYAAGKKSNLKRVDRFRLWGWKEYGNMLAMGNFVPQNSMTRSTSISIVLYRQLLTEGQDLSVCDRETIIPAHIQNSYELRQKNIRLTITI